MIITLFVLIVEILLIFVPINTEDPESSYPIH